MTRRVLACMAAIKQRQPGNSLGVAERIPFPRHRAEGRALLLGFLVSDCCS